MQLPDTYSQRRTQGPIRNQDPPAARRVTSTFLSSHIFNGVICRATIIVVPVQRSRRNWASGTREPKGTGFFMMLLQERPGPCQQRDSRPALSERQHTPTAGTKRILTTSAGLEDCTTGADGYGRRPENFGCHFAHRSSRRQRRLRNEGSGCSRLVRLQHVDSARRPHAGWPSGFSQITGRRISVVLGIQHARRYGRPPTCRDARRTDLRGASRLKPAHALE